MTCTIYILAPVPADLGTLYEINIENLPEESVAEKNYKNLLKNQISWCNANRDKIYNKAFKLYNKMTQNNVSEALQKRCCNFKELETAYIGFINSPEIDVAVTLETDVSLENLKETDRKLETLNIRSEEEKNQVRAEDLPIQAKEVTLEQPEHMKEQGINLDQDMEL